LDTSVLDSGQNLCSTQEEKKQKQKQKQKINKQKKKNRKKKLKKNPEKKTKKTPPFGLENSLLLLIDSIPVAHKVQIRTQ